MCFYLNAIDKYFYMCYDGSIIGNKMNSAPVHSGEKEEESVLMVS